MAIDQQSLLKLIKAQKQRIDALDAETMQKLIDAYQTIYRRLAGDIDALLLAIEKAGGTMTRGQLIKLAQYQRLMVDLERELTRYSAYVETEISMAAWAIMYMGSNDAQNLLKLSLEGTGINASVLKILWPEAIEKLLGYLEPGGPLMSKVAGMTGWAVEKVREAIISGVGMGKNPLTTARELAKGIEGALGMNLTDSMRMMRTVQLYSYREANRANFLANSDVVKGWIWYAELDDVCCMSCVAMHGTFHTLDETLDDHHNGRCTMLPVTYTMDQENVVNQTGEDWFKSLGESDQRKMMGPGKFEAWKEGKFELNQIPVQKEDDVYGLMRTEASLKELLGE